MGGTEQQIRGPEKNSIFFQGEQLSNAKTLQIILVVIASILFISSNGVNAENVLAKNGKAGFDIVIKENAPEPVIFAAEELKSFLKMITGADFKITNNVPGKGHVIILGDCPATRKAGIDVNQIPRDGYVIKTIGNNLFIAGKDTAGKKADIKEKLKQVKKASFPELKIIMNEASWDFERGTLYGVYRFLEKLGVRWFFPGNKGTVIPEKSKIELKTIDITEAPHFEYRSVGSSARAPYAFHNNEKLYQIDLEEFKELEWTPANNILWNLRQRGSSMLLPLNHRPKSTGWVERFAKSNPEYFALLEKGKRDIDLANKSYRSHLCYSHPDVFKITIGDIKAFRAGKGATSRGIPKRITERHPANNGWHSGVFYGNVYSLLPNDSFRACHCGKCKKLLPENPDEYGRTHSRLVWTFIEKCARELKKKGIDGKITCLAYESYGYPYKGMGKLPDNVIVGLCPRKLNRPYLLADDVKYQKWEKLVERWDELTDGPLAFWEHCMFRYRRPQFYAIPLHIPHLRDKVFKKMAKHGKWAFIQTLEDSIMFEHFHRYAMLKTLYNPQLNIDELFNDYIKRYYGPEAGPIIKSIYEDIEKRNLKMLKTHSGWEEIWEKYFTSDVLKEYRRKADKAVRTAKGSKYENAAKLFSKYYVGLMEKGYRKYDKHVRKGK